MTMDDSERMSKHSPGRGGHRVRVDGEESTAMAVVDAVSEVAGVSAAELPVLQRRIDTDALDALFGGDDTGGGRSQGHLEFTYADCRVTVYEDGEIVAVADGMD